MKILPQRTMPLQKSTNNNRTIEQKMVVPHPSRRRQCRGGNSPFIFTWQIVLVGCLVLFLLGHGGVSFLQEPSDYYYTLVLPSSLTDDTTKGIIVNKNQNTAMMEAMQKRSITVPAIRSTRDDGNKEVVVPSHFLSVLDNETGECLLPGKDYCDKYRNAKQDPHVDQSIMSVLHGRCTHDTLTWDFGGNIGYYTFFMRAMGCHVTTIEPQPSMNKFLNDSIVANGWDQDESIAHHEKGVSDMSGKIKLQKLWQPGNKNAGSMEVDTITISQLKDETKGKDVEILKLDIDGPEIYSLRGILKLGDSLLIKNIVAELTVKVWERNFGVSKEEVLDVFDKYYDLGYYMLLINEGEFPKYPKGTMSKLREIHNFREIVHAYEIPREYIGEVLYMGNAVTKNIFMTKDDVIKAELDASG